MLRYGKRVYTGRTEGGKDRVPKEVYVNGLWILLANAETRNVITLYRVDLGCALISLASARMSSAFS